MSIPNPDQPCTLYEYRDACGVLLYIGITNHLMERQKQHSLGSAWFPLVRSSSYRHFATRTQAESAEREAIRRYRPPFNRAENSDAWVGMIRYFMERMPQPHEGHHHEPEAHYRACDLCGRCAEYDPSVDVPAWCLTCESHTYMAYDDGQRQALLQGKFQALHDPEIHV